PARNHLYDASGSDLRRDCGVDLGSAVDVGVLQRSCCPAGSAGATAAGHAGSTAFGACAAWAGSRGDRQVVFGGGISRVSGRSLGRTCQNRERVSALCRWSRGASLYLSMGRNTVAAALSVRRRAKLPAARQAIGFCQRRASQRTELFVLLAD